MDVGKINRFAEQALSANESLERINALFNYDTEEEQGINRPGTERIDRCNVFIEIGGPATHCRIHGLNRREIEMLRTVLIDICETRKSMATENLRAEVITNG